MARDCIFYSESHDMGATIPFCVFEYSSRWICCEYYDHRDSTQERCPHYISKKDGLEALRRQTESRMTRRDKLRMKLTDDQLWDFICEAIYDCCECPMLEICKNVESREEFKDWLDKEVEE